ncbi:hypothetical protein Lal_00034049 [Lupinus albus]|nr:hypothetical protein Lal_00034049 [Lupinus albus]
MANYSPPTSHHNPPQCCCRKCCGCGCILCTILVIIIIILITFFSVPTAVLKLPHFQVKSLSLTNFVYTQSVTGTWQINLLIHNPNDKFPLNYDTFRTVLYYKNATLSESHIAPFSRNIKSDTTLNVTISAANVNVEKSYSLLMNKEIIEHGSVEFNVEIVTSIKFGTIKSLFKEKHIMKRDIFVECSKIQVRIMSNATSGELADAMDCQSYNN